MVRRRQLCVGCPYDGHPGFGALKDLCDQFGNLVRKQGRHRVSYLAILMCPRAAEVVVVREGLQPGSLADCEASTLMFVIVNEVMTVLCYVAGDRCCRPARQLDPE